MCHLRRKNDVTMDTLTDYAAVIAAVSRATGIPERQIFGRCRGQLFCDARWIAVQLFSDLGYYSGQIADLTGMTARNVNLILSNLRIRENSSWKQFGRDLETCRKVLGIQV